jgi:hypothetical protein
VLVFVVAVEAELVVEPAHEAGPIAAHLSAVPLSWQA